MGAMRERAVTIRVGVVGTGFAAWAHLDALSRIRAVEVAGVVGSTAQRGLEAARRLGVDRAYPDLDAMLGDRSVDVVHNCTPNDVHREVSAGALAAGKHVLSEKPLGLDSAETAALVEAAASAEVVTGVCFTYRHFP